MVEVKTGFENRKARVEFLPLIDVVFLLLVFFVYALLSMVVHRGIEVSLPTGGSAQVSRKDYVNITIDAQNQISVDGMIVTLDQTVSQVKSAISMLSETDQDIPIFIAGDQASDLGISLKVLDRLRTAGYKSVSFELEQERP
jgi:biopolymer transport protein ExbD